MHRSWRRLPGAVPLVAGLLLAGCAEAPSDKYVIKDEPATLEVLPGRVAGVELARVRLTDKAIERLGIETVEVEQAPEGMLSVPSGAVILDADGRRWVYTNPAPLTYVRELVTVAHEAGERAFLSAGPPLGTGIVTVGAAELHGAETGIGK
ncbi:MAG: hypothetical protein ACRDKW_07060 [Actinomycetota bacterium]